MNEDEKIELIINLIKNNTEIIAKIERILYLHQNRIELLENEVGTNV